MYHVEADSVPIAGVVLLHVSRCQYHKSGILFARLLSPVQPHLEVVNVNPVLQVHKAASLKRLKSHYEFGAFCRGYPKGFDELVFDIALLLVGVVSHHYLVELVHLLLLWVLEPYRAVGVCHC